MTAVDVGVVGGGIVGLSTAYALTELGATVRVYESGVPGDGQSGGARTEHDAVVVCAGRGTAGLARGVGLALPVRLSAHARLTFGVTEPAQPLACLQDSSGAFGETGTYAAALPGNRHYAVGLSESVGGSRRRLPRPRGADRLGRSSGGLRAPRAAGAGPGSGGIPALLGHPGAVER